MSVNEKGLLKLSLRQRGDKHPLNFKAGRGWGMNLNMAGHPLSETSEGFRTVQMVHSLMRHPESHCHGKKEILDGQG